MLDELSLASIGRTIGYNDPQYGGEACNPTCEGDPDDRNVELLVDDPREGEEPAECETAIDGTPDADNMKGTGASERIRGRRGADRLNGKGGDDCVNGGRGRDRIRGGRGEDLIRGGGANDRINVRDGDADEVRCGTGRRDHASGDEFDVFLNCERL
jgi:Ca2+-binding RTX toxin-like protein